MTLTIHAATHKLGRSRSTDFQVNHRWTQMFADSSCIHLRGSALSVVHYRTRKVNHRCSQILVAFICVDLRYLWFRTEREKRTTDGHRCSQILVAFICVDLRYLWFITEREKNLMLLRSRGKEFRCELPQMTRNINSVHHVQFMHVSDHQFAEWFIYWRTSARELVASDC